MNNEYSVGTYGFDLQLLRKHLKPIELANGDSRVLIVPEYQGRVMTSSAKGLEGFSYGWINHKLIASGEIQKHINAFGGEERIWFGPEGGQFSIFFEKDSPFDLEHWQTPACIDTEVYDIQEKNENSVLFTKKVNLTNYSGTNFDFEVLRKVQLLNTDELAERLNISVPESVKSVAYESDNQIKNTGSNEWTKESGALSIWMLGMLNPSPEVTVVIPYKKGNFGEIVNDNYFGDVPADRLVVTEDAVFFKADGKFRSKIGMPPSRALPVIGSFDAENKILTILECTIEEGATDFVNSAWELQEKPFGGDVINSYNDGPLDDGSQMGPFYELESSSKAGFLKPGESLKHTQRTYHFEGNDDELDKIAEAVLGVSINKIDKAFN